MGESHHQIAAPRLRESIEGSGLHASSRVVALAVGPAAALILLMGAAQAQSGNTVIEGPAVTVPGSQSSPWNIPNNLMVGDTLGGTLIVESGGTVNGTTARIGAANVTSTVTVQDAGSAWTNTDALSIGVSGLGQLNILNGGSVRNTTGEVGVDAGGTGIVNVSGSGSQWTNTYLALGWYGAGTVTIGNGGSVIAPVVHIGAVPGSQGTLNLNGEAGSRGVITADYFMKGLGDGRAGTARINLNGGILRASMDNVTILAGEAHWPYGFAQGDVVIGTKGAFIDSNGLSIGVSAALEGVGALTKLGAGTLTLSGTNTYTGGTVVNAGVLAVSADANLGHASGPLTFDGGTLRFRQAFDLAAARVIALEAGGGTFDTGGFDSTISQNISGPGSLTKAGAGALTLTGTNTYTGGTLVNGGTLVIGAPEALASGPVTFGGGTLQFAYAGALDRPIDVSAGGFTLDTNGNAQTLPAPLTGTGAFTKNGAGTLNLTANNPLTGPTSVREGRLAVNGSLTGSIVTVHTGASIGGTGTVGGLIVQNGGFAAPGNSIGTLNVAGDVTFGAGSVYQVEVNAAGLSDRIVATGSAILNGGTVQVLAENGAYQPSTTYNILTAAGGRTGTFSPAVTSNLAYLIPLLSYDANSVLLTLEHKAGPVAFSSAAVSSNQYNTANAVEALRSGNPLYDAVVGQSVSGARQAFDMLSGEAHATGATVAYRDSTLVRDAITRRLRQPASPKAAGAPATPPPVYGLWAEGVGAWGRIDHNGNAAGLNASTGGFVLGADAQVNDTFQIGVAGGFALTNWGVDDRLSSGSNDSIHAAFYGSGAWGGLNLRLGTSYAWHHFDLSRNVTFPGFSDRTSTSYDGWTAQAFGELGYEFHLGDVMLEPFIGASVTRLSTGGFVENGGPAALTGHGQTHDLATTTLGIRAEAQISQDMPLTVHGLLGWRHAHGEVNPSAQFAFSGGPSAFTIAGAAIDRDSLVVGAGLDWQIDSNATLGVSYSGQFGERSQDHALKGNFSWRF